MALRRLFGILLAAALALTGTVIVAPAAAAAPDSGFVTWGDSAPRLKEIPKGLKAADVMQIAGGGGHVVALKSNGTVVAWGNNANGQTDVPRGLTGVVQVAAGGRFSAALKSNGTIVTWGNWGLADAATVPKSVKDVVSIVSGASSDHLLAVRKNGAVISFGTSGDGRRNVPADLNSPRALATGWRHSVAITKTGQNIGWGANTSGQAHGLGGAGSLTALAAGAINSIGLTTDGRVVAVGSPTRKVLAVPAVMPKITDITMGWWFALALGSNGRVYAWGEDVEGQTKVPALARKNVRLMAATTSAAIAIYGPGASPGPFPDVASNHLHVKNIEWLADKGITKPVSGNYMPAADVNRGAMMTFLHRIVKPGKAIPKCTAKPYSDVPTSHTHCGAISWAKSAKILPAGSSLGVAKSVTRADMAVYMYKAAHGGKNAPKCTSSPFQDVSASNKDCGAISWAKVNKITTGMSGGKEFGTNGTVNRGSMASFLKRLYEHMH